MFIEDYMTPDPMVVHTNDPLERLSELVRRRGIHHLPVVDEVNRLVGIVTDRDLRSAMGYDPDTSRRLGLVAEDIMTSEVVTITPGEDLQEGLQLLCRHNFGALPVVVGDHVVGILSTRDLLRRLAELLENVPAKTNPVPWPVDSF